MHTLTSRSILEVLATVEIFGFPPRPPPRVLNYDFCPCNPQMARMDTQGDR